MQPDSLLGKQVHGIRGNRTGHIGQVTEINRPQVQRTSLVDGRTAEESIDLGVRITVQWAEGNEEYLTLEEFDRLCRVEA